MRPVFRSRAGTVSTNSFNVQNQWFLACLVIQVWVTSMASLKQQLLIWTLGCLLLTLVFGGLLSIAVNLSLKQLQDQPDLIVPGAGTDSPPTQL